MSTITSSYMNQNKRVLLAHIYALGRRILYFSGYLSSSLATVDMLLQHSILKIDTLLVKA